MLHVCETMFAGAGTWPVSGIRPGVPFRPTIPLRCDGTRIDPPPSVPMPIGERPCRYRGRLSAARPTGSAIGVPRRVRATVHVAVRLPAHQELWDVRLSEQYAAGIAEPAHDGCIVLRHEVDETRAHGHPVAGRCDGLLARERNAVEQPQVVAAQHRSLSLTSLRAGILGPEENERVQPAVEPLDPGEMRVDQLDGRDLTFAHEPRLLRGALVQNIECRGVHFRRRRTSPWPAAHRCALRTSPRRSARTRRPRGPRAGRPARS